MIVLRVRTGRRGGRGLPASSAEAPLHILPLLCADIPANIGRNKTFDLLGKRA
jgi:hypothetical protein